MEYVRSLKGLNDGSCTPNAREFARFVRDRPGQDASSAPAHGENPASSAKDTKLAKDSQSTKDAPPARDALPAHDSLPTGDAPPVPTLPPLGTQAPQGLQRTPSLSDIGMESNKHALKQVTPPLAPSRRSSRHASTTPEGALYEMSTPEDSAYSSVRPSMPEREIRDRRKYDALEDWRPHVRRVETVRRIETGLEALVVFRDGVRLSYPTELTNARCPQAMIAFYESRVRFVTRNADAKHDTPKEPSKAPART